MKRLLLILPILVLSCSKSFIKPTANLSADVSILSNEQTLPSPIPIPTAPTPTETPTPITCTVTAAESLHMRDSPGISGIVINWLKQGDQLTLLPDPPKGDWIKVTTAKALTGWVNSTYCEMTQ